MTLVKWRNRLTTHFSECIPVVKRRISVYMERWPKLHSFLTSVLDGSEMPASRYSRFNLGKDPGIHWIGGFVSPLQVWKFCRTEKLFSPTRIRTQTLYPVAHYLNQIGYPVSSHRYTSIKLYKNSCLRSWNFVIDSFASNHSCYGDNILYSPVKIDCLRVLCLHNTWK
jgi:hypothetical protein